MYKKRKYRKYTKSQKYSYYMKKAANAVTWMGREYYQKMAAKFR